MDLKPLVVDKYAVLNKRNVMKPLITTLKTQQRLFFFFVISTHREE